MSDSKPSVLLMGQTPPPWHGQAVATQILFDHTWPEFSVERLRMEFSEEMQEVGRFQWKKVWHLVTLALRARKFLKSHPGSILFYPPASAKWVPFLRDLIFLVLTRPVAGATVFIYHASGLPVFAGGTPLKRWMARKAYGNAEVALEVAQEKVSPHQVFRAKSWRWCPCAIAVPILERLPRLRDGLFKVLFVGSLQEGKGVLEIIKTAAVLKARGWEGKIRFEVVGKWFSRRFELEALELRSFLGVEAMVLLPGQLTGEAKWQAFGEADLFFFPTHYESEATPIVLMEALGAGLPIVSTRWAGIPAMLEGCPCVVLLDIKAPDAYAEAICAFVGRFREGEDLGAGAREYYNQHFLPERFVERVGDAFRAAGNGAIGVIGGTCSGHSEELREQGAHARLGVAVYLADQNPGFDRSFGISRMTEAVLRGLIATGKVALHLVVSSTSQQGPDGPNTRFVIPWGTRRKSRRVIADHLHPLLGHRKSGIDLWYYPKGFLPIAGLGRKPKVVTIHDTIIQHYRDQYPSWRNRLEYFYWASMLKYTLRNADRLLTVSESSRAQIEAFRKRHQLPGKPITVTYEPCSYEFLPQPESPAKENFVIHLASREPHKRTAHLVRWWIEAEKQNRDLPTLHLIGTVPDEVGHLLASSRRLVKRPFLEEETLVSAYQSARALILPSEIEGFGLPALEAYYLGTPVCFVRGTSVEEVLGQATRTGGFELDNPDTLFAALADVMSMPPEEVRRIGLLLREQYASEKVARRMLEAFREVVGEVKSRAGS